VNWLGDEALESIGPGGMDVLARIRSSGALQPAKLHLDGDDILVDFAEGEDGVSPGQACVFYALSDDGERLLGGGWIKSAVQARHFGEAGVRASGSGVAREPMVAGSR
jgi:tRNA-specific 2-thiouridylase